MTAPAVMIPAWPRAMDAAMAGSYCSCTRAALPAPSYGTGRGARWLRDDLDAHLDELAGKRQRHLAPVDEWADVEP